MELTQFLASFPVTNDVGNSDLPQEMLDRVDAEFIEVVNQLGGKSFRGGLYRVFRGGDILKATLAIEQLYPKRKNSFVVFGCDWLGRQFAIDRDQITDNRPEIILVETGGPAIFEIPAPIVDFHNVELVAYTQEALARDFFNEWKSTSNIDNVPYDQCVGYKVPLFLGGSDTVDNLELGDMDVYLEICAQLKAQI